MTPWVDGPGGSKVAFNPEGDLLASRPRISDATTGRLLLTLPGCAARSARTVCLASAWKEIRRLWRLDGGTAPPWAKGGGLEEL